MKATKRRHRWRLIRGGIGQTVCGVQARCGERSSVWCWAYVTCRRCLARRGDGAAVAKEVA